MDRPYLFRFMRKCIAPNRARPNDKCFYDETRHQLMTLEDGRLVPVVDAKSLNNLVTKKADIEKGEDQKDNWMRW